jgi:hypothetical protein
MLSAEQQGIVRRIVEGARKSLEGGSAAECTKALEKIAEVGRILSEVILYDPASRASAKEPDGTDSVEEL